MENYLQQPDDSNTSRNINNLKNAMENFPQKIKFSDSAPPYPVEQFTPQFILDIHKEVASGLMDEVGMNSALLPKRPGRIYDQKRFPNV